MCANGNTINIVTNNFDNKLKYEDFPSKFILNGL